MLFNARPSASSTMRIVTSVSIRNAAFAHFLNWALVGICTASLAICREILIWGIAYFTIITSLPSSFPRRRESILSSLPRGERARERVKTVAFARLARYFFLRSQAKVSKKKATPLPLTSFCLSATLVRLRNSRLQSSNSPRRLTHLMLKPQIYLGSRQGDLKSKPYDHQLLLPLFKESAGVSGLTGFPPARE